MGTKLKTLQEWCRKLTLPTSGGKAKCLRRLQKYKLEEEQRISLEISKKLFAEEERRPLALRVPKTADEDGAGHTQPDPSPFCWMVSKLCCNQGERRSEERG